MKKVLLLFLVFILVLACNKEEEKVTQFLKQPLENYKIEFDSSLIIYNIEGVTEDEEENYYVLNSGEYQICKFNKDFNLIKTFGRMGRGPGEFPKYGFATDISLYKDTLFISSFSRMHAFSKEGDFYWKKYVGSNIKHMKMDTETGDFYFGKHDKSFSDKDIIIGVRYSHNLRELNEYFVKYNKIQNPAYHFLMLKTGNSTRMDPFVSSYINFLGGTVIISVHNTPLIFSFNKEGKKIESAKLKLEHEKKFYQTYRSIELNKNYVGFIVRNEKDKRTEIQIFDKDLNYKKTYKITSPVTYLVNGVVTKSNLFLYNAYGEPYFYKIPKSEINFDF